MENEDVIRDQMENTRTSISEKLETLEQKVANTVTGATTGVTETVENVKETVKETVNTVKDTVQGTVTAVKETVHKGVDAVKHAFDLRSHVQNYPMWMFAGSVAAGYAVVALLLPAFRAEKDESWLEDDLGKASAGAIPQKSASVAPRSHMGNGSGYASSAALGSVPPPAAPPKAAPKPSWIGELFTKFGPEINKIKSLALGALVHSARDMLVKAVPPNISSSLTGILDGFADKIGADPTAAGTHPSGEAPFGGNGASKPGSPEHQAI